MGFAVRLRRRLGRLARKALGSEKVSYAQCGEDIIIEYVLTALGIDKVRYLDIGAHDPVYLSNTFYFYRQSGSGVCVEPNPALIKAFKTMRPSDVCLNVGVGEVAGTADFFVMTTPTLSTFSRAEAERYQSYGTEQIERVIPIEIKSVNQVIEQYFDNVPHLVSIDVEGFDLAVLKSIDFSRHRPQVICVETLTYAEDGSERKLDEVIAALKSNDYFVYADTHINTVAVDRYAWTRRPLPVRKCANG
jgi:FkbM family methyltransferase